MANWIKLKTGLYGSLKTMQVAAKLDTTEGEVIACLYRLAAWFSEHGKYGKLTERKDIIDIFLHKPGFADALIAAGWAEEHGDVLLLKGFCDVSAGRKSLGRAVRERVLSSGRCAACGNAGDLEIDHIVPIVRGGSCDEGNLQALCQPCNRAKGRKTMEEFIHDR